LNRPKALLKKPSAKAKPVQKKLTQLHFIIDSSILVSCPKCGLSYTRGAAGDESLHRSHCARVLRGMEWGREEERERDREGVEFVEIDTAVKLKDGRRGRIICYRADAGGKIGAKVMAH
jgi:N-acetyltransferase